MATKGCASCLRIFLIVLNCLFVFCGLALIGLSLWMYYNSFVRHMEPTKEVNLLAITFYCLIAIGGVTVIIGICGCCGAYHENKCLLGVYFFLIFLILGAEVAGGIIAIVFRSKVEDYLGKVLSDGVTEIKNNPENKSIQWIDYVQQLFGCCGSTNFSEYGTRPPQSCCHGDNTTCSQSYTKWTTLYLNKGCKEKMIESARANMYVGCGVVFGIAGLEIFAMIFAIILCCSIRDPYDQYSIATKA